MLHAIPGEHYVEFVADGIKPDDHPSFPSRVDDVPMTTSRLGAQVRLRAEVILAIQHWIARNPHIDMGIQLQPADTHHWKGQRLTIHTASSRWESTLTIRPDDDGLYELSSDRTWFLQLSVPTTTAATIKSINRKLVKPSHLRPESGEVLVTLADSRIAFPAVVDDEGWNGAEVPYFRPEIAKIIGAWLNYAHLTLDDAYARTYWEGDTLIVVESNYAAMAGYHPDHVKPERDGRYAIGWRGWAWESV
ncbi:hypothetical protein [Amycolatopsis thailandensis]|uniref:hypothetical protein n=1 Tax=Amycolatopsis thailandensis TaxID=589330 RepID=UPI00363A286F